MCSASDQHDANFECCVLRAVSSHLSHHPYEVILAQISLYVDKDDLNPHSFHLIIVYNKSMSMII